MYIYSIVMQEKNVVPHDTSCTVYIRYRVYLVARVLGGTYSRGYNI